MNKKQLKRVLYSCGMGTFACYYNEFTDKSIPDLGLQKILLKAGHANTQYSAKIKARSARLIINRSKGVEALRRVANANAKKVAYDGVDMARNILNKPDGLTEGDYR